MISKQVLLLMYFRIGNGKGQGANFRNIKIFKYHYLQILSTLSNAFCLKRDYKYYFLYYFNKILMFPLVTILLHLNKHMQ